MAPPLEMLPPGDKVQLSPDPATYLGLFTAIKSSITQVVLFLASTSFTTTINGIIKLFQVFTYHFDGPCLLGLLPCHLQALFPSL